MWERKVKSVENLSIECVVTTEEMGGVSRPLSDIFVIFNLDRKIWITMGLV